MEPSVRIHNWVPHTKVLGPGDRAAIWFQGCHRACKGCMSPGTRPTDGGTVVAVDRLFGALAAIPGIEGITVSGGEPFLQPDGLYALLKRIREETKLSVIIYTGYTLKQLRALGNPEIDAILDGFADIVIDGEYVEELNDGVALRGSSNQQVHFLTDRYRGETALYKEKRRNTEVIATERNILLIGIPTEAALGKWYQVMEDMNHDGRAEDCVGNVAGKEKEEKPV